MPEFERTKFLLGSFTEFGAAVLDEFATICSIQR